MKKVVKISPIPKEYSPNFASIDSSLARHGYVRAPGTGRSFLPVKEKTGLYRTGLDVNAPYLKRLKMLSEEEYNVEVERITKDKERLEKKLECTGCLDPNSDFYNFASFRDIKVTRVVLSNGDYFLDMDNVLEEITWNWLRVHPFIAVSLEAYRKGDVAAECQFYIADSESENKLTYSRKKEINTAIANFEKTGPDDKKRIARLMALPVTDYTSEEEVYNIMDSALKEVEFKSGRHKGMSTVRLFNEIYNLTPQRRKIKDLVEQALLKSIYRERMSGRIFEGEVEISKSKDELIAHLMDDSNQDDLLVLEKKLIAKKFIEVL